MLNRIMSANARPLEDSLRTEQRQVRLTVAMTAVVIGSLLGLFSSESNAQEFPVQCDPRLVVSSGQCARCHAGEVATWRQTPHAQTFEELHRRPEAREIARRMGFNSIKRGASCRECHYTVQQNGDRLKPISGISCESCHGAAARWLDVHNDYGGPGVSKLAETAAHKEERRRQSIELGMRNPSNLYLLAQSCLNCHTVGREALVNRGGHKAGSPDFELVSWSQGRVRHNFLRTGNEFNALSSPQRLRVMYVVGLIADLEYSTRATAKATEIGPYGLTLAQRAADRALQLKAIQDELQHPLLQRVLIEFSHADLKTNNEQQLIAIADSIRDLGIQFADEEDGSRLSAVDSRLPPTSHYR